MGNLPAVIFMLIIITWWFVGNVSLMLSFSKRLVRMGSLWSDMWS